MMIYVYRDEEVRGPFHRLEVFARLREGTLADDDNACLEGSEDWQPLRKLLASTGASAAASAPALPGLKAPAAQASRAGATAGDRHRLRTALAMLVLFGGCASGTYFAGSRWYRQTPRLVALKRAAAAAAVVPTPAAEGISTASDDVEPSSAGASMPVALAERDETAAPPPAGPLPANPAPDAAAKQAGSAATAPDAAPPSYMRASFTAPATGQRMPAAAAPHDLFQTPTITPQELSHVLETRFSTALLNPPPRPADPARDKIEIQRGSFILETSLKWNPRVEVIYSIPLYNNVTPVPRASNIVMLGFHPGAMAPPKPTIVNGVEVPPDKIVLHGTLDHYAREFGFTAFRMRIVTREFDDPVETYFLGGTAWTDIVFRAQDELTRKFHLPPRKLLLEGMSLGATFVERIAASRPERVAAVAFHSAPEITIPKTATDTLWYMQITRGDSMQSAYDTLYNGLLKLDDHVLFDILPPSYEARGVGNLYHSESGLAKAAADAFLDGVASRRDSAGNLDPAQWPYARRRSNPVVILSRNSPDFPRIPLPEREFLPSEQFVHCLQELPVRVQATNLPAPGGRTVRCYVGLPPLGRARGVLIYAPETAYTDLTNLFDNVYFLAQKGYVVLCPYARGPNLPAAVAAALDYQRNTPALKDVPAVFVGAGESGRCLWEAIPRGGVEPRAVALINFKPEQALDEARLPFGARPIRCPVFFIDEEKRLLSADTAAQARETLDDTRKVDAYVGLCRERHQMARIVLIGDSEHSKTYDAQKSIEAVNNAFADIVDGQRGFIVK